MNKMLQVEILGINVTLIILAVVMFYLYKWFKATHAGSEA